MIALGQDSDENEEEVDDSDWEPAVVVFTAGAR